MRLLMPCRAMPAAAMPRHFHARFRRDAEVAADTLIRRCFAAAASCF